MTSLAAWACLGWLSGWLASAPPAPANGALDITVRTAAPCADRDALVSAISQCWIGGSAASAPPQVSVVLDFERDLGGRSATFALVVSGRDLGERRISPLPTACRDVVRTVATAICIALDLAPNDEVNSAAVGEAGSRVGRRSPVLVLPTIPAAVRPRRSRAERSSALRFGVDLGLGVVGGAVPGVAPAVQLGATVGHGSWSARLGMSAAFAPERAVGEVAVSVSLLSAELTGCARLSLLRLCALARLGVHDVSATGLIDDAPSSAGYAAFGAAAALVIPVGRSHAVAVGLDAGGAPWRSNFVALTTSGVMSLFSPAAWTVGVTLRYELNLGP